VFLIWMRYSLTMHCKLKQGFLVGFALLISGRTVAFAVMNDAPATREQVFQQYQAIVDRNPFGLKPPPPPPAPPEPQKPPEPKVDIFLTGIVSVFGPKRVFLKSTDPSNKDPNKKDTFYNLTEGQSKDGIEVLKIDARKREVKIRTGGDEKTLSFAANGIKPPSAPPPAVGIPGAQPGMPTAMNPGFTPPPQHFGQPGNNPNGNVPTYTSGAPIRNIPSRAVRSGEQPAGTYNYGTTPNVAQANPGPTSTPGEPAISPEQQYLMIKANEQLGRKMYQRGQGPEPAPVPDFHLQ
jgi:hypothetical protein